MVVPKVLKPTQLASMGKWCKQTTLWKKLFLFQIFFFQKYLIDAMWMMNVTWSDDVYGVVHMDYGAYVIVYGHKQIHLRV